MDSGKDPAPAERPLSALLRTHGHRQTQKHPHSPGHQGRTLDTGLQPERVCGASEPRAIWKGNRGWTGETLLRAERTKAVVCRGRSHTRSPEELQTSHAFQAHPLSKSMKPK